MMLTQKGSAVCKLQTQQARSRRAGALPVLCGQASGVAVYDVRVYTPPHKKLGLHVSEDGNVQCGSGIEVHGHQYVVQRVAVRYKFSKGKYRKDHTLLDVTEASRWILNGNLNRLLTAAPPDGRE